MSKMALGNSDKMNVKASLPHDNVMYGMDVAVRKNNRTKMHLWRPMD